jgi:hypothetical protein
MDTQINVKVRDNGDPPDPQLGDPGPDPNVEFQEFEILEIKYQILDENFSFPYPPYNS